MSKPDRRTGTVLSETWRLDQPIGSGGMASVFAGVHLRNRLRVAVKVLHPELARNEAITARFLREGYVANRVEHPGVVRVLDDGIDGDHVYMVMELLQGKTLKQVWEGHGRAVPADEVERIVRAVLEVLRAAHAAGVVHRDLKPDNVFRTDGGEIKLLDFGIARIHEEAAFAEFATATGTTLGTPAFMPPEQALGRWDQVDGRADLFALAATAWMLLTGKLLHEATTIPELLIAAATRPARPIQSVASVPARLAAVLDRALSFAREDRWPDAAAMLRALDEPGEPAERPAPPASSRADTVTLAAVAQTPAPKPAERFALTAEDVVDEPAPDPTAVIRNPSPTRRWSASGPPSGGPERAPAVTAVLPRELEPAPVPTVRIDVSSYQRDPSSPSFGAGPSLVAMAPAEQTPYGLEGSHGDSQVHAGDARVLSTQDAVATDAGRSAPSMATRQTTSTTIAIAGAAIAAVAAVVLPLTLWLRAPDAGTGAAIEPSATSGPPNAALSTPPAGRPTESAPLVLPSPDPPPTALPSASASSAGPAIAPSASVRPAASPASAPPPPAFVTKRVCGKEVDFNGEKICRDVRVPAR